MRYLRSLLHAAVSACLLAACGGTEPSGQTASIAGTVRNVLTNEPLEGAMVSAGGTQATTDANGQFGLASVLVGSVTIRSQRTGFVTYAAAIVVQEGSNTHDIRMTRDSVYELSGVAVYVPTNVSTVRGVILHITGGDSRAVATDVCTLPNPVICDSQRRIRLHYLSLAATHGLAIMGSKERLPDHADSDARVLAALAAVADQSDRPELAQAPLLISGNSGGAPQSYGFTLRQPERVIGLMVRHGVAPSTLTAAAAQRVPAYVLLAELDEVVPNAPLTAFFATNRAEGALWAYAIEPGTTHYESTPAAQSVIAQWMNTILGLRLPPTVTPDEASGWLGNVTTFAIAAYADYADDRLAASWFPSQGTAQAWHAFVTMPPDTVSSEAWRLDARTGINGSVRRTGPSRAQVRPLTAIP